MRFYKVHAYGLKEAIQITEAQMALLEKFMADTENKQMLKINGYWLQRSAIGTIEPAEENPSQYLVETYNQEAARGLHEPYWDRSMLALPDPDDIRFDAATLTEDGKKQWDQWFEDAPKRDQFRTAKEYLLAKVGYYKENGEKLAEIKKMVR